MPIYAEPHPKQPKIIEIFENTTLLGGIFPGNKEETLWYYYLVKDPLFTPHGIKGNHETAVTALIETFKRYQPAPTKQSLKVDIYNGIQSVGGHAIDTDNLENKDSVWETKSKAIANDLQKALLDYPNALKFELVITVPFNPVIDCERL